MTKDEIVKQEIVEKAQVLFQQFGMKKTTMDEIAHACGKAKSTLYHYFKSKEEVFGEVLDMEVIRLRQSVKIQVEEAKDIKGKILNYFLTFHSEVIKTMNLYRTVMLDMNNDSSKFLHLDSTLRKNAYAKFLKFEKDYLTRIFEDAFDSGEFTKIPKDDLPFWAETLIAALFGVATYSIEPDASENHEKMERTARILINQIYS